jgi:hypothetical protein
LQYPPSLLHVLDLIRREVADVIRTLGQFR